MQLKLEFGGEKGADAWQQTFEPRTVFGQEDEIIGVADVVRGFKLMRGELVELVHVDVHEELGGEVAQREAFAGRGGVEALYHFCKECDRAFVCYPLFEHCEEYLLVDGSEKLPYVALEHPAGARVVLRDSSGEGLEAVHRPVCPLPFTTGIRVGDECAVEEWVQLAIERVMHEAVAHERLVDVAGLGVVDAEVRVWAVVIGAVCEVAVEGEDVSHQVALELLHVRTLSLAAYEFFPGGEQVLDGDDIVI